MTKRIPIIPETAIERVVNTIAEVAPDNVAPIPVAMALHIDPTVGRTWVVHAHIRRPGLYELDWETTDPDLEAACKWIVVLILRDKQVCEAAA